MEDVETPVYNITPNEELREIIAEIRKEAGDRISEAKRIKELIRKKKKWIGEEIKTVPFKEPVMFFQRRSGDVEFYENVTQGLFEFKHSDGEKRFIIINPSTQVKLGVGGKRHRGYWAHEDHPTTGMPDPIVTTEQINIIIDKSLNDLKKWKAQEIKAQADFWWKILIGVAIIIAAIALFKVLTPAANQGTMNIVQALANSTNKTLIQNLENGTITII